MPLEIVTLNPKESPQKYYETHASETLGCVPDGTGLQIVFEIEGEEYLLSGPRVGALLTVNGGQIEDPEKSFLCQLQDELDEETFGVLKISNYGYSPRLWLNGSPYPLRFDNELTAQKYKPGKYAYMTFTARCTGMTLEELKDVASKISPTAKFWEKLGSFLHRHVKTAPQDAGFASYWREQQDGLNDLLNEMTDSYNELTAHDSLRIKPEDAFNVSSIDAAWDVLRNLATYKEFMTTYKHTVGRYSERSEYAVFKVSDVYRLTQDATRVHDVTGKLEITKIFNKEVVERVFPLLAVGKKEDQSRPSSQSSDATSGASISGYSTSLLYGIPLEERISNPTFFFNGYEQRSPIEELMRRSNDRFYSLKP